MKGRITSLMEISFRLENPTQGSSEHCNLVDVKKSWKLNINISVMSKIYIELPLVRMKYSKLISNNLNLYSTMSLV